jgi:hypothetical protein
LIGESLLTRLPTHGRDPPCATWQWFSQPGGAAGGRPPSAFQILTPGQPVPRWNDEPEPQAAVIDEVPAIAARVLHADLAREPEPLAR